MPTMAKRFEPVLRVLNEAAWFRRIDVPLESTTTSVVCLEDLLVIKRAAGRPRDLDDVAVLELLAEADDGD